MKIKIRLPRLGRFTIHFQSPIWIEEGEADPLEENEMREFLKDNGYEGSQVDKIIQNVYGTKQGN